MSDHDQQIENEISRKGLNAPRLTPDLLESKIASEHYHVFPGTTVTACLLMMENGFHVLLWKLEDYLLWEKLHQGRITEAA